VTAADINKPISWQLHTCQADEQDTFVNGLDDSFNGNYTAF